MEVPSKLPTGSNDFLLCGPSYLSWNTSLFFFVLWLLIWQLIFPTKGKLCLPLLHGMKSKFLRIMYKVLVTWRLLPFGSYDLQWSSYQNYNINQLLGAPGPSYSGSWIPRPTKEQRAHQVSYEFLGPCLLIQLAILILPACHTSRVPLCCTWLTFAPFYTLGKQNQNLSCREFMSVANFWRKWRKL